MANLWLNINKVIDQLLITNHKRPDCKVKYSPEKVADEFQEANLMVCEHTFCYLGRFKKVCQKATSTSFQGDQVGLYLLTQVCIQTFLRIWVCKRSVFCSKGLYNGKMLRNNDKIFPNINIYFNSISDEFKWI